DRVKRLRAELDAEIEKLSAYSIDIDAFERAMRLTGAARREALEAMMDTPPRAQLLAPVLESVDRADETRAAFEAVKDDPNADPSHVNQLLSDAGEAEEKLEVARRAVIAAAVTPEQVRAALEQSRTGHSVRDSATGQVITLPSPREQALKAIESRIGDLSGARELLESIVSRFDTYAAQRKGLDDPSDLIRLLRGAGVLNFRIAVR